MATPPFYRDGRPVRARGATVELRPEGVYLRWPDCSGAFYAASTVLMPVSGGSQLERDLEAGLVNFDEEGRPYSVSSWAPLNLDAAKRSEGVRPPVFLERTDGVPLIYAGRRHSFWGPSETFKSWVALLACKSVIEQGGRVLYIDFEDDEVGFVERARTLGIPDDALGTSLLYVRPEEPIQKKEAVNDLEHLRLWRPALVVIDGVTEAMSLHGLHPYDPKDTARYQHLLVRGWNAATIEIDHTGKDGRTGQLGSVQKKAGIDGVSVEFEAKQNEGRGGHSTVKLFARKDRHGHVKKYAPKEFLGTFHLITTEGASPQAYVEPSPTPATLPVRVLEFLQENPASSTRDVKSANLGPWGAVERFIKTDPRVKCEDGPNRSKLYSVP